MTYGYGCFDVPLRATAAETASTVSIAVPLRRVPQRNICAAVEYLGVSQVHLCAARSAEARASAGSAASPFDRALDCTGLARDRREAAAGNETVALMLKQNARSVLAAQRVCSS